MIVRMVYPNCSNQELPRSYLWKRQCWSSHFYLMRLNIMNCKKKSPLAYCVMFIRPHLFWWVSSHCCWKRRLFHILEETELLTQLQAKSSQGCAWEAAVLRLSLIEEFPLNRQTCRNFSKRIEKDRKGIALQVYRWGPRCGRKKC